MKTNSMIFFKRTIYAIGWIPVAIIGIILTFVGAYMYMFTLPYFYIKTGDSNFSEGTLEWQDEWFGLYRKLDPDKC